MKLTILGLLGLSATSIVAHNAGVPRFPLHQVAHRQVNNTTATTSTSASSSSTSTSSTKSGVASVSNVQNTTTVTNSSYVGSTILVIVRDSDAAGGATAGLNAYGIPFQVLLVPQTGATLPVLNTSSGGNFGGIIVASDVSYNYANGWASALTNDQWNQLYAYQITFSVRMVQYDVYPQALYGVNVGGSCCGSGVEQLFYFTNTSGFTQAGINSWAGVSTMGLFHYTASISDPTTTWEVAQYGASDGFAANSTAAVINNFAGRQQMVIFTSWANQWSTTCNYIQHSYITWMTRGLYVGYRRVALNTQVDDMFLRTNIFYPGASTVPYRVTVADMAAIAAWVPVINKKMNAGSSYKPEIGHNGNGNMIAAYNTTLGPKLCGTGPVYTAYVAETSLEYQKPLGTGVNAWPLTPTTYAFTSACSILDPMAVWWRVASNRNQFMHITHTFTHYLLDNSTTQDTYKEITFNQAWLKQMSITSGSFTSNGLIPPAITGLHNGDAIAAWVNAGLTNCVGDNSRPLLRNSVNPMYSYTTTNDSNGYAGFQVIPRWPTRIYFNCDTPACTLNEWVTTSGGSGDFSNLMANEKSDTLRYLLGLYHDGYMFHQINLRATGVDAIVNPDGSTVYSLIQAWVEQTVSEFTRLVNWPMITYKQSDLALMFSNRMARDACNYQLNWTKTNTTITGVTVTATGNTCSALIPLTVPGSVKSTQGFTTEKIGNDPLTIWVKLTGKPVTFTLSTPIKL